MRGLSARTIELIQYVYGLLEKDNPMTLRQLHYRVFSGNEIAYENTQAEYRRLSRVTTAARRRYRQFEMHGGDFPFPDGVLPPNWMVDETRAPETVNCWEDVGGYLETVKRAYRRDNWMAQPNYIEVWSEKGTVLGSIRPIAAKWGITTRVLHGFGSAGLEHSVGEFFESVNDEGKDIYVLFLGDHDPSGRVIEEDIHRRVEAASGVSFEMRRLAIEAADIKAFNLPPQKIKSSDSRAPGFRRAFGDDAATVELDALPPEELRRRIDATVSRLVDHDQLSRDLRVQEVEYATIADVIGRVNAAKQPTCETGRGA